MNAKVAACVVLYQPSQDVIFNMHSYYQSADYLIAIDNSETENTALRKNIKERFPNTDYIHLGRNTGISGALNMACRTAIEKGYDWLLTMDQDSCFEEGDLQHMIDHIHPIENEFGKVGIITPYHVVSKELMHLPDTRFTKRNIAMTSGNLLNLYAYEKTGEFDENLFIDFVDYEYSLKLRHSGFLIIQDNTVHLRHSLGNYFVKSLFGYKVGVSNHNSIRRYYKTRNSLYVGAKYWTTQKRFFLHVLYDTLFYDPLLILLYENNKLVKFKSVYSGIRDFFLKKYGKR